MCSTTVSVATLHSKHLTSVRISFWIQEPWNIVPNHEQWRLHLSDCARSLVSPSSKLRQSKVPMAQFVVAAPDPTLQESYQLSYDQFWLIHPLFSFSEFFHH